MNKRKELSQRLFRLIKSRAGYLAIVSGIGLAASIGGLLLASLQPGEIKQEINQVSYSQSGKFNYAIALKPSYLFGPPPEPLPPDPRYPLAAVESIDFSYSFSASAKKATTASIEAVLENPGIWQKKMVLVPNYSAAADFTIPFSLDLTRINGLFDEIEKETGIDSSPRTLHINANVNTGSELSVQSLIIKMDKSLLEISSKLSQSGAPGSGKFDYTLKRKTFVPEAMPAAASTTFPVEIINTLNFTFNFKTADQGSASAKVEAVLENPGIWQKTLLLAPQRTATGEISLPFGVDIPSLQAQFLEIEKQIKLTPEQRLITLKATVTQGNNTFVQSLPITIARGVLSVPTGLTAQQALGSGRLDYTVRLLGNIIYAEEFIKPTPAAAPAPLATAAPVDYEIATRPAAPPQPGSPAMTLTPGQTAFIKLADAMEVNLNYVFKADQPVNKLNSEVEVTATLEAPQVWTKKFGLVRTTKPGSFNLNFPVELGSYAELLEAIRNETGVSAESYNLSIAATIHTTGETAYGKIDETFKPILKGTIKGNVLQWDKELASSQSGALKKSEVVANNARFLGLEITAAKNLAGSLMLVFCVLFSWAMVTLIRSRPGRASEFEREGHRIKKKYGARMIEADGPRLAESTRPIQVKSLENLVKVADELAKPIIHQSQFGPRERHSYYVMDGETCYLYALERRESFVPEAEAEKAV